MLKPSKDKNINQLLKKLVDTGWIYKRRKKHGAIISPSKVMYIVPLTPSDNRAFYNFRSHIRKDSMWRSINV